MDIKLASVDELIDELKARTVCLQLSAQVIEDGNVSVELFKYKGSMIEVMGLVSLAKLDVECNYINVIEEDEDV